MSTMTVEVTEAQTQLSKLVALALQGNEVVITENEEPIAHLVPIRKKLVRRMAGLHRGAIQIGDDFDVPLPDSFWIGDE